MCGVWFVTPWSFSFFVGLRYTGSRKKNQLVSFLSAVSMAGLIVGVALLITVLSVMNGFDRELRERILGLVPQAAIYNRYGIEDWPALLKQVESQPDVVAAAPFIQINALVSYKKATRPIMLYGMEVEYEKRVSLIDEFISADSQAWLKREQNTVVLGKGIADHLGVSLHSRVMMVAPSRLTHTKAPTIAYFTVIDIIESGTELDQLLVLTSLETAARLASLEGKVDGVRLKVNDLFEAQSVAYQVLSTLGSGHYQTNWTHTHGNLHYAIQMSKNMVGLLMSLIVAIAAFNVVSTLIMVVTDKQGDIAILRTLGASNRVILLTFLAQGCLIGILGIVIGIVLGCGLCLGLQSIVQGLEALLRIQFLHSDVYPLTYLPTQIRLADILQVAGTAMVLVLLAAIYPAWKATKIAPAEALRYE